MKQLSIFDLEAVKKLPKKLVIDVSVDSNDKNADWLRKGKAKEIEIIELAAAEIESTTKKQKVAAAIKATIEARAAALDATIDKDSPGD